MRQAVILAGGKSVRLRERLGHKPKPLVDICGTPLLERQVALLKRFGFTDLLLLVNYAADQIVEFCASRRNWGLNIECKNDGQPLGTAGATLAASEYLAEEFLLVYGDTMLEVDLQRFHNFHIAGVDSAATLFVHPNDHPHDSDLVEMDDNRRIIDFHPYPRDASRNYRNLVNAALYWVRKAALAPWCNKSLKLDFAKDLFPLMLADGLTLRGYNSPEYIKDCGTPERLDQVCADFRSGKLERASLIHRQAAVFLDRDGTLNREVDHLASHEQLELLPGVAPAIRRLNSSEYRCCVVTNQPVIARGECTHENLRQIHNKLETLLGCEGAFIDRIYYCPHHPDKGFPGEVPELKIRCDCRKPDIGMIDQAVSELNIALERSWMIGDTSVDMLMARRAGLKAILVETGYAGLDQRVLAAPDFVVPDLPSAVELIVAGYPRLLRHCSQFSEKIKFGEFVFVGGQSRSGKSTFASVLRDAMRVHGKIAHVISADRWLLSESSRGAGVMGRFDIAALRTLVSRLAEIPKRPYLLSLPGYLKRQRQQIENAETFSVARDDIVILEGTIALELNKLAGIEAHAFHVEIDEDERKRRVLHEYKLRGFSEAEAISVYTSRLQDEFPIIDKLSNGAVKLKIFPSFSILK